MTRSGTGRIAREISEAELASGNDERVLTTRYYRPSSFEPRDPFGNTAVIKVRIRRVSTAVAPANLAKC
jgi:hypothetical protein